ncbi:PAS domain S-box protein [Flavobacterium sp. NRK F7]|uniref:PAS domain S-box protein n=1 Tax=Flavobacterium sp. NRK F7 TaxID=2954930 RepID=UPI0020913739|nr:PAS domain S-box protein [Flavobacterium sp. NRK F7]MCO6163056.1 PAS domain S-box protein [Flavobacterium sp. NRK F7]
MGKNIYNLINWFFRRPRASGLIVFISLSLIFTYIAFQQYKIDKENRRVEMTNTLHAITQNIDQTLKNCYTTTLTLALTIDDNGIPKDFDVIGRKLLASNSSINAVQMVPNGIIKYTYPLAGNEKATGLDILKSDYLQEEALKSIETQKMYFAGPFELKQGGQGIVGRLPVYIKDKFWGFSAVIIKMETLLETSGINSINSQNFSFQLSKINPKTSEEVYFLPQTVSFKKDNYVSSFVPDGDWNLYILDKKAKMLFYRFLLKIIFGILLALTFTFFIILLLKKPEQLEQLVKEQANKLVSSELRFKTIFEQAALGIANVDGATGRFIEINDKFCKIVGYTESEMKEKSFQEITHPDDLPKDLELLEKVNKRIIKQYSLEKRYFDNEGKIVWVNLTVTPLLIDNDSNTFTLISIVEDITLKKETEELIKKSENHFKSLFEDSPLPLREENFSQVKKYLQNLELLGKDVDFVNNYLEKNKKVVEEAYSLIRLNNVNQACLNLYQVKTIQELISYKPALFNKRAFADFKNQLIAITQNKKQFVLDTIIKNANGELRYIDLRWNVIRGYEDSLNRIIVSTEDITDRKSNEQIILNSQQRIASLINTIDGIVWECDAATFEFTFISKKVEHILGYTDEEWLSEKDFWKNHIYEEDRASVIHFCTEQTKNNLDHDFEYRMIAKDGSVVWLRDIINVVVEDGKVVSLRGIMINITKTKEIEKELHNSFNLVSEQNKRLLNFSYIVSHNLRSHTSNISSLIGLIEITEDEKEKEEMLGMLKTVSGSLNETMINLNEVVNIQTNISLTIEKINLLNYIEAALQLLAPLIKEKNVSVIHEINPHIEVNYNSAYMESILYNILSNAIRYSHPNRKPTITIRYYLENEFKVVEISDNGIGIDLVKNKDKIFGMYKTFSKYTDSKGIGLFITKNQVEAMGGTITVESKLDEGTTFKIYIL